MNIWFEKIGSELILCYKPDQVDVEHIFEVLNNLETWRIRKTFFVTIDMYRDIHLFNVKNDYDFSSNDTLSFCVGKLINSFYLLDAHVFGTNHKFYIQNDSGFAFEEKMFVCKNNISILRAIDLIVDSDVYIGQNDKKVGFIPVEEYQLLVSRFPGTAELKHYTQSRIASILVEYFDNASVFITKYDKFVNRRKSLQNSIKQLNFIQSETIADLFSNSSAVYESKLYKLEQFKSICLEFENRLNRHDLETQWQPFINDIIRFIFPKYIISAREVVFDGIDPVEDDSEKKPDFILVDTNGFIDILEVKKPDVQFLTIRPSYRKNFIATRELVGAIQQIEKYIFCLNHSSAKNVERISLKLSASLPDGVALRIINPQGLLILGRSDKLNPQQRRDFELIKRQYKSIIEIMTYDDLYNRLKNIVQSLEIELKAFYPSSH